METEQEVTNSGAHSVWADTGEEGSRCGVRRRGSGGGGFGHLETWGSSTEGQLPLSST